MNLGIKYLHFIFSSSRRYAFKQIFLLIYFGKFRCVLGTPKTSSREAITKFDLSIERH